MILKPFAGGRRAKSAKVAKVVIFGVTRARVENSQRSELPPRDSPPSVNKSHSDPRSSNLYPIPSFLPASTRARFLEEA